MTVSFSRPLLVAAALVIAPSLARAGDPFSVKVDPPTGAKVGAASTARVVVKAAAGYHLNKDYPTSLKLVAPTGVELAKAAYTVKDGGVKLAEGDATVEVSFTPKDAGTKAFTGTFKFAVCTENTCVPSQAAVTFAVDVK